METAFEHKNSLKALTSLPPSPPLVLALQSRTIRATRSTRRRRGLPLELPSSEQSIAHRLKEEQKARRRSGQEELEARAGRACLRRRLRRRLSTEGITTISHSTLQHPFASPPILVHLVRPPLRAPPSSPKGLRTPLLQPLRTRCTPPRLITRIRLTLHTLNTLARPLRPALPLNSEAELLSPRSPRSTLAQLSLPPSHPSPLQLSLNSLQSDPARRPAPVPPRPPRPPPPFSAAPVLDQVSAISGLNTR